MKTEDRANEYLPLRDVVFNTLRENILTGEMKPGERLMEIHLANRLGVSRTPIREAIRMLELEGLVTMVPRKGAEVAQISEKGLRDVLEVRQALDALAMELACERITEEEVRELRAALEAGQAPDAPHGVAEEVGDVLFMASKSAQMSGTDPEEALHSACDKFDRRFRAVEEAADKPLSACSEAELLALWEKAKRQDPS